MIDTRFAVAAPPRVHERDRPMTDAPVAAQDQDSRYRGPAWIVQGNADPLGQGIASTAKPVPSTCCWRQCQGSLALMGVIDIVV
jgi:hypothetical protein